MKKIFTLIVSLFILSAINAQTRFGVKAGVNVSSLSTNVNADFNGRTGFYVGGTANVAINEKFSVQPELLFSNKGYSYDELGGKNNSEFNYLAVPVVVRYTSQSGFYGETGPQFSFLMSAKVKNENIPGGEDDIKDAFKSTAFSWGLGIGYNLSSGLGIGARYSLGISSISDNGNINSKFNVLRLGLSWTFGGNTKKEK